MKNKLFHLLLLIPFTCTAQNGITFAVEELEPPKKLLHETEIISIYQSKILSEAEISLPEMKRKNIEVDYGIVAYSKCTTQLVQAYNHPLFYGMYQAYADHRPFVLSPDMMWTLISQGFAQHVNQNSEKLRKYFVDFEGKETLVIRNKDIDINNPESPWEDVFPEFTKQIAKHTGEGIINTLTNDFSTSTPTTKIASEITIMEAMQPYFKYVVMYLVCGIPEVTLEGTPNDWQHLLKKTKELEKYELNWWTKELTPILEQFIKASEGDVDKKFWMNMFKYHTQKEYGAPMIIDGWIVKFFPYDKNGKRNNLNQIKGLDKLADGMAKVDLLHIEVKANGEEIRTPLELQAGFIGLQQNKETFALRPEIGWKIQKKDTKEKLLLQKIKLINREDNNQRFEPLNIVVDNFPTALLNAKYIKEAKIQFIKEINIPDEIRNVKIDKLTLTGKVSEEETKRIVDLLKDTELTINKEIYNK